MNNGHDNKRRLKSTMGPFIGARVSKGNFLRSTNRDFCFDTGFLNAMRTNDKLGLEHVRTKKIP